MNKNLAVTLVGAVIASISLVASLLPDGGVKHALTVVAETLGKDGPLNDLLMYLAGAATVAGFGRLFPSQPDAKGRAPDQVFQK